MAFFTFRVLAFVGLNALRVVSLVSSLLVWIAVVIMMVEDSRGFHDGDLKEQAVEEDCTYIPGTEVPTHAWGIFWAELHSTFLLLALMIAMASEINWGGKCEQLFSIGAPMLGRDWSVAPLGVLQVIIASSVLSHYMDDFPLVVSWMLFVVGCINLVVGLLYRAGMKDVRSIFAHRRAQVRTRSLHPNEKSAAYSKLGKSRKSPQDYGATSSAFKAFSGIKGAIAGFHPGKKRASSSSKARHVSIHEDFPSIETESHRELLRQKAREANARIEKEQAAVLVDIEAGSETLSHDFVWDARNELVHERSLRQRRGGDADSIRSATVKIGGYANHARTASRAGSCASSIHSHARTAPSSSGTALRTVKRRSVAFARSARSRLSGGAKKGLRNPRDQTVVSFVEDNGIAPPMPAYRHEATLPVAERFATGWADDSLGSSKNMI